MTLDQFQLGLLVAAAAVFALAVMLCVVSGIALWAWAKSHDRGSVAWTRTGFKIEADLAAQRRAVEERQQ